MATTPVQTYGAHKLDCLFDSRDAKQLPVNIKASQTIARGTILGEVSATPGTYAAFTTGAVDGTQNPKGICVFDLTTDASGNITSFGDYNLTTKTTPMFVSGYFDISQLVDNGTAGILATTVTSLGGLVIEGVAASGRYSTGILKIPG